MIPPREPVKSEKSELELLAALPGARLAEQLAVIHLHTRLALEAIQVELDGGWIGPEHSPLGREWHVAAVERLMRAHRPEAAIVEGRHLLTIAALANEYFRPLHEAMARATPANDVHVGGGR